MNDGDDWHGAGRVRRMDCKMKLIDYRTGETLCTLTAEQTATYLRMIADVSPEGVVDGGFAGFPGVSVWAE